jgi:tol-pal system protein YbgF
MMMFVRTIVLLLPVSVFFLYCAGTVPQIENEALLPEIDVIQVKENSDEALKLALEAKLDVDMLNTKIAEFDNKMVLLSEEVSSVSAAKIDELETRLALLIEAFKDLHAQIKAIEAMPVKIVTASKKTAPDPTFSPSSASSLITSPEYDLYQSALQIFNARKYDQAIVRFNDLLKQYPSGQYVDNAQYWIGESFYATSDFASAIASFQKVVNFKNSQKGDDAQLKIGLSYLKMGEQGVAKAELKKLVDRYPSSEYVPRAQKYLSEIK